MLSPSPTVTWKKLGHVLPLQSWLTKDHIMITNDASLWCGVFIWTNTFLIISMDFWVHGYASDIWSKDRFFFFGLVKDFSRHSLQTELNHHINVIHVFLSLFLQLLAIARKNGCVSPIVCRIEQVPFPQFFKSFSFLVIADHSPWTTGGVA